MSRRGGRKAPPRRRSGGNSGVSTWLVGAGVAAVVVVLGVGFFMVGGGPSTDIPLPSYVRASPPAVREAYIYAVEHPEVLRYMPCYCGCGGHSGHQSNWNCFVSSMDGAAIVFDDHGYG